MPDYEYKCYACGTIEKSQTPADNITREHHHDNGQECANRVMRRVRVAPAVVFKGTGWAGK